jgi:tetratricopeptide (TPR) repeat protein
MRPILRTLLPLVALLVSAAVAVAQPDPLVEARAHYQAGTAKFAAAQYDEAVAEFRAADALAPSPMNDFNIGLALDRKGDAAGAVAAYRSYLNRSPNAANRGEVEARSRGWRPPPPPPRPPPPRPRARPPPRRPLVGPPPRPRPPRPARPRRRRPAIPPSTGSRPSTSPPPRGAQPLPAPSAGRDAA